MDEDQLSARYVLALREHWIYVLITVALAVAGATAYVLLAEERYEATADVLVSPVSSDTLLGLPVLRENVFGRSVVTAARLTKSPQVASRVRERLQLSLEPSAVNALIRVTPQEQSDILSITGTGRSPTAAALLANAFAQALLAERTERLQRQLRRVIARLSSRLNAIDSRAQGAEAATLSNRLADYRALLGERDPTLEIVIPAVPPTSSAWPRPVISIVVAAVIGLLVGGGIAVGLEIANPLVMRAEAISERSGPPILARMPRLSDREARAALLDPRKTPMALREPIRTLWANLGALSPNQSGPQTFLVTSADEGEGSPAVASVIAGLIARAGKSVALMDADLEHGPLAAIVDGDATSVASIGELLASKDAPVMLDGVEPIRASRRLRVLLARPEDRHLTEWVPPDRLSALATHVKGRVDALVISAPPLPATETTLLTDMADVVIIAVAVGRTRRDRLTQLRNTLAERGVVPAGYVALERPSLSTRISRVSSDLKP